MTVHCDRCGDPLEMDASEVAEHEANNEEIYCEDCIEELETEDEEENEELEHDDEA